MQNYQINTQKNTWNAIGVMSGTSVDGLDIAAASFSYQERWDYTLIKTDSIEYPAELKQRLLDCINASAQELVYLDLDLGSFIAHRITEFLKDTNISIDLVASHGHTVFHQPENGMTKQIGDGQTILQRTGIPTINDFRTMDVLNGGQGAPLVPMGDQYLFPGYDICLNIGGFANISFNDPSGNRIAFDTGPANLLLNYLSRKTGRQYDPNGEIARRGKLIDKLYNDFNNLSYYTRKPPKSLGLEWVKDNIFQVLDNADNDIPDLLFTCARHISCHINKAIQNEFQETQDPNAPKKVLVTGGGAHNQFLMDCLKMDGQGVSYILPSREIIDYKEALIFAFLGILRYLGKENILRSATGAKIDSIGGTVHNNIISK
jgi:anhydro-N-acetylmuramic acid kinase